MKTFNAQAAVLAGVLGTLAMTMLMYGAPLMGLPPMDLLGALGGLVPLGISPYVVGGLMHLGIGVSLAVLYGLVFERILPGPRWIRGATFALLPWLFAITLMGPAMAWLESTIARAEARSGADPTVAKIVNPCSATPAGQPANPCAVQPRAAKPANPCAAAPAGAASASPWLLRAMSLMAHLAYGTVVAMVYRRRVSS